MNKASPRQTWLKKWCADWTRHWLPWSLAMAMLMVAMDYLDGSRDLTLGWDLLMAATCVAAGALGHGVAWLSGERKQEQSKRREQNTDTESVIGQLTTHTPDERPKH